NIESVTKEFFEKYKELFISLCKKTDKIVNRDEKIKKDFSDKNISIVDFSKKLLGQIVFLYFLQKKGWLGVKKNQSWGEGSKKFLRELFDKKYCDYKNFFNDILEPLFYEALAVDRGDDSFYKVLNCRLPFLNGGLFEPLNNYDWKKTDLIIHNELFLNNELTKEGDEGTGILNVFGRYNFTVCEEEPLEKEVAVDPEMLGKVFEKLLDVKDRKEKGSFYTPREIVHNMCGESLKNYLSTYFKNIDVVFENDEREILKEYSPDGLLKIREVIKSLYICDPACGSGAFLVGMLNEMMSLIILIDNIVGEKHDYKDIIIKKGEKIIYNPDEKLNIECEYLEDYKFNVTINNENKGIYKSKSDEKNNKLTLMIKMFINDYNKKRKKSTIANLFSQGRIENQNTFNAIRTHQKVGFIIDEEGNKIWEYKDYETQGKYRRWREQVDEQLYYYNLKKDIIQKCIYGVDIDPGAVDIAKLRFWLALVVEYEGEKIEPLPNLDYKIMQGNSLLEEYEGIKLFDESLFFLSNIDNSQEIKELNKRIEQLQKEQTNLLSSGNLTDKKNKEINSQLNKFNKEISKLSNNNKDKTVGLFINEAEKKLIELKELHKTYFNSTAKDEKDSLKKKMDKLEWEMIEATLIEEKHEEALNNLMKYKKANVKPFFLWKLHFAEVFEKNEGFDIVIANPPYVRADSINENHLDFRKQLLDSGQYKTLYEKWDLYIPFIERSLNLLSKNGLISYIVSDAICTSKYAFKLLDYIQDKYFVLSIDYFTEMAVFDAGVNPVVLLISNNTKINEVKKIIRKENFNNIVSEKKYKINFFKSLGNKAFKEVYYPIEIKVNKECLGNICYISVGMVINADENIAKGEFGKDDIISNVETKICCKKYVEGKYISSYTIKKIKYLEWDTERVPSKIRRKTFPELYDRPKIIRGSITGGVFDENKLLCNHSNIVFIKF
ncbi:MAG: Eco57I restriction-modification methylase domain-containing protein, partial [Spirochaetes bacterium]|nr:Eco57I restriction-modification methylase domain-containing protein [Spirochaetota bacterium]